MSATDSWHWAGREFAGALVMVPPGPAPSPFGRPATRDEQFIFEWHTSRAVPADVLWIRMGAYYSPTVPPPDGIIFDITI